MIGMLGVCPEAEDIGQEVFLRFYQSLDKFRGESSVGTYLTRIAINLSLNELRRRKLRQKFLISRSSNKTKSISSINHENHQKDIKNMVRQAIQKLNPKFREVIVIRLIDGYSTQETAQILNLPLGTVFSRLARAQMKLKKILRPLMGEENEKKGNELQQKNPKTSLPLF